MSKANPIKIPFYTKGEEIFNMVSHICGGGLAVAGAALCVIFAALHRNTWGVVSSSIYGATMILLYTMSSIYHGLNPSLTAKKVFRVIDHCSIFLLIAGTYTPYTLCTLRMANAGLGWVIFGVVWGMAALGITFNAIDLEKYKKISLVCYLIMGWCIIFTGKTVLVELGFTGSLLLILGGISYTIGAIIYGVGKKHRYMHSIFHLFVCLGTILQFFSIFFYVI